MAEQPHIVLFSGGTACRAINIALSRRRVRLTRIVPAWDSGGSSKALREMFGMLPVGDIRQALMTMAHGEGHAGGVVKICNARLSGAATPAELRRELDYFADGAHPLLKAMSTPVRDTILKYLDLFRSRAGDQFDLRNGSIGNFILTGAYLANGANINRAISVFRRLCAIDGEVWPASVQDDVQLSATLRNGTTIDRQDRITRMADADAAVGVEAIALYGAGGDGAVASNEAAIKAVAEADLIVFGPGSFYTSILPHVLVGETAAAVAGNQAAPKVFVGNILECAETRGIMLATQLEAFLSAGGKNGRGSPLLTHAMANSELFPFAKTVGPFPYLKHGALEEICRQAGITPIVGDFEDAWVRGQHDGEAVAAALLRIVRDR